MAKVFDYVERSLLFFDLWVFAKPTLNRWRRGSMTKARKRT
jgi:hypothetical protein